jgi:hypothetical protein
VECIDYTLSINALSRFSTIGGIVFCFVIWGGGSTCPPNFFKGLNFVMKSALFVQANVAVHTKLTSKVPFLFVNFQFFLKNLVKNYVQFRYATTGKFFLPLPRRQHFREKCFRCPFRYPKVPL